MLLQRERPFKTTEQLQKLFGDELGDLLHTENMLMKALPKMAAGASSPELRDLFQNHLAETRAHITRVEKVFIALGQPAREKKCEAMMGLLVECQHLLTRWKPCDELDRALICAGRKIEALEMIAADSLMAWAKLLGEKSAADLLSSSHDEEEAMSRALGALQRRL